MTNELQALQPQYYLLLILLSLLPLLSPEIFPGIDVDGDYDLNEWPTNSDTEKALEVSVSFYLGSIFSINEPEQVVSIKAVIRCSWRDQRIRYYKLASNEKNNNEEIHFLMQPGCEGYQLQREVL